MGGSTPQWEQCHKAENPLVFIAYLGNTMVALSDEHILSDDDTLTWKEVPEELESAIAYFDVEDNPYGENNSVLCN